MLHNGREAELALENGEFIPHFQSLVLLRTGELTRFEVLARWVKTAGNLVPPNDFIPMAERDGWIGSLMRQILRKAFQGGSSLPTSLNLAVNVSPLQLQDLSLPKQILSISEEMGFAMERVVVEITESALMNNLENGLIIARELKMLGCRLSLDDFGTGYSSLQHLQALPFDELKVDGSFVKSMTQDRESRKIVAAVVGLGQSLGLNTVAEGVETREQAEMLLWMGCEMAQGWLFGKPVPEEQLAEIVAAPGQKISIAAPSLWVNMSVNNLDAQPAQRLAQLQAVYDGAPVGLGFLDCQLRYVNLNRRLADMNGTSVEEHLGRNVEEMMPGLFPQLEPHIRRALEGEAIAGVEVNEPGGGEGGKTRLLSYQPARDEAGEVVGVSVAVVDITQRKLAEDALRESEDHYRHMVELNPQTPWIMDPEGLNLDVSPRWERTTELALELTREQGWLTALHPDDQQATVGAIAASRESGESINVEYRVSTPEGGWRWMRSRGSPRYDVSGQIVCWYGSVEDIDERKQLEEKLRRYEETFGPLAPSRAERDSEIPARG